ncbi:CAP domain-containing protein, partial [Streptomyces olivaceus]
MGSRRAARPSRSHARPRGGLRSRGAALALGADTGTGGVGNTLAVTDGDDGGSADRVVADSAGRTPNTEDAAGGGGAPAGAAARARTEGRAPP